MDAPAADLAKKIVDRLVEEKLISEKSADKFVKDLANGKVRQEDWRTAVEQPMREERSK